MLKIKDDSNLLNHNEHLWRVPLKKIKTSATICSLDADVTIKQIFRNDDITSIEAVYYFLARKRILVYAFAVYIDEQKIVDQLEDKNNSLHENNSIKVSNQDTKFDDNFMIDIGVLPPSKECTITFSYVTKVNLVDKSSIQIVVPDLFLPATSKTSEHHQSSPYIIEFDGRIEDIEKSQQRERITQVTSSSH